MTEKDRQRKTERDRNIQTKESHPEKHRPSKKDTES